MKKIIFSLLCIMMLCSTVTFAAETETVGGTITLTQFLGVSREDVKSVAITTNAKTDYVDKNAFYDISDSLMLTSAFEPELMTTEGTYITVEKTDGSFSYAFIGQSGGVDRYSALMSRLPYALYTADNASLVNCLEMLLNGGGLITVNENLDIKIDGKSANFTLKPFIDENGRTLVAAREICGYLNGNIYWFDSPQRVAISTAPADLDKSGGGAGGDNIWFTIGENKYRINADYYETDTAARLVDGSTFVPLRPLAEFLGYNVVFIPAN